jgi:N-acetyl-alpha-D-muramate 1-phosphate uridylyltransferase
MKAMILAAGRGERLRPLTERLPKPLVEAGGKALIDWHLQRLAAAGCREAVINVSHLAEQVVRHVGDGARYGMRVAWSREAEPLETAGGIANAAPLLGEAPFLLVNSDIYCECDFSRLKSLSLEHNLGHLVLVPNPPHHPQGDFTLESGMVGNGTAPRYTYAGVAVVSPELVANVRAGDKAPLGPLLRKAAGERRLSGELHRGLWTDVGTAARLDELRTLLASR